MFIFSHTYVLHILFSQRTAGTFKLWSLSNFSTEYLSSERHDGSVPKMKNAKARMREAW